MHAKVDLGVGNLLEVARGSALLEKAASLLKEELEKERKASEARESALLEKVASVRKGKADRAELRALAAKKLAEGAPVTRAEAAAFLGVSTKKLQRMEAAGKPRRCPGLHGVVRYEARDILRLASANGKEA